MFGSIVARSEQASPRSWRRQALLAPVREVPLVHVKELIPNHIGGWLQQNAVISPQKNK